MRIRSSLTWMAVALLMTTPQACASQSATLDAPPVVAHATHLEAIEQSRALVARRIAEGLPGFSLAVAIDGETVWAEAMGQADIELGTPATTATRFRIGSTSKSITSALAGRLSDAGLVDLDADVRVLFPDFPTKRFAFSLVDLLSNQAGIRHYRGLESLNRTHYASVAEGLEIFENDTLLFEPHTYVSYSSYGFNLAGAVLANAAGTSFKAVLQREVFEPLGMLSSGVDDPTIEVPDRASFYSHGGAGPQLAPPVDDSYKAPSGGLLSTPSDLVRFGAALLSGLTPSGEPWLEAQTLDRMFSARPIADGRSGGYALGFRVQEADPDTDPALPYAIHHGGSSIGGRSMFYMLPEHGIVVSILCNSDEYDTKEDDAAAIGDFFMRSLGRD